MQIIKPSYEILTPIDGAYISLFLEKIGRTCYKSEGRITKGSDLLFLSKIIERNHEAMLEHFNITVKFICDRGISHELVRHRLASFAQESTRYCNYGSENKGITFIQPCWFKDIDITGTYDPDFYLEYYSKTGEMYDHLLLVEDIGIRKWFDAMMYCEQLYNALLKEKWKPEEARLILPNSLKTEIVITANLREWRHIFELRAAKTAHPQMQELMIPLFKDLYNRIPIIFNDLFGKIGLNE